MRLCLANWTAQDAAEFYELSRDPGFSSYLITDYRQASVETAREWIAHNHALMQQSGLGKWAVRLLATGELIGMGGLTPWTLEGEALVDITYRLRQSAWGQGYGLELARLLLERGTTLGLTQLTATITPDNAGSLKIIEKIGFSYDRRILLLGVETELYRYKKRDSF